MTYERRTVKDTIEIEGRGLHTGTPVSVSIFPAEEGIRFRFGADTWQANPENVTDTTRCTRLGLISTVEHLMSAFAGAEVTDALVEVDAPELPAMDGSALPYLTALEESGTERIGEAEFPGVYSRVFVQEGDAKIAISAGEGRWRYEFQTPNRWPGEQVLETTDIVKGYPELAGARTFAFQEELVMIQAAGLGRGLDAESALILGPEGYLNTERCADEPVRHKMLDAVGDIYLAGVPLRFLNVVAIRTGHTATVKAAAELYRQVSKK